MLPTKRLLPLLLLPLFAAAYAQVAVSGESTQVQALSPGESYQGTISLTNSSEQPATVNVYQTDYLYHADGTTEYGKPGSNARSNALWVSLPVRTIVVPPEGRLAVSYQVQVPDKASLAGSYWSLIMVEQVAEAAEAAELQDQPAVAINTVVRYAVEVVTNVGTTGERKLELANPTLQQTEDTQGTHFHVDVTNPGERYLTPEVYLELYDETGNQAGRFGDQQRRLFPGTSVRQNFDLGKLTPGDYTAVVIVDAGGDDVFGARYTLEVGDGNAP